jgi:hypothetical protein
MQWCQGIWLFCFVLAASLLGYYSLTGKFWLMRSYCFDCRMHFYSTGYQLILRNMWFMIEILKRVIWIGVCCWSKPLWLISWTFNLKCCHWFLKLNVVRQEELECFRKKLCCASLFCSWFLDIVESNDCHVDLFFFWIFCFLLANMSPPTLY